MFILLLIITLGIALAVSAIVVQVFAKSIDTTLRKVVPNEIGGAWQKYMKFAIYVFGIAGGVKIDQIKTLVSSSSGLSEWAGHIFNTIIGALKDVVWLLLIFFVFILAAYVIIRVFGTPTKKSEDAE